MLPAKQYIWPAVPLFLLAAFALYSNTFQHAFHFDDFIFIVNNPEISNIFDLHAIWQEGSAPTRFVTYWTFALNYHFHQFEPAGYHVVNIFIHGLNAVLVYWLTLQLGTRLAAQDRMEASRVFPLAGAVALIFLCHPLQTQAVTYLCQRFASLATLFYLLSVCCYVGGRGAVSPGLWWLAALASGLAGMFTKQIVLTLPLMILIVEWLFFSEARINMRVLLRRWPMLLFITSTVLIIPAVYGFNVQTILLREFESWSHRGDTLNAWSYFLTQSRVIWTYIRLLFVPVGQNLLYDFPTSFSLWDLRVTAGFIGIAVLVGGALKYRRKHPIPAFAVLWFFTALLVESSFIPIRHVIFEHRVYLPMFGFALLAGHLLTCCRRKAIFMVLLLCVVVGTLSTLTYRRNAVWENGVTLWSDVSRKSPRKIRPYTHLATAYLNAGEIDKAVATYSRAIDVNPERAESYNNRGNVYTVIKRYDLALQDYQRALELDPTLEKTYNNLGIIYNKQKRFERALQNYNKALALNPANAAAYFNRANVYLQKNQLDKAFADYSRSIEQNPFQKKAYYYRSQIYATEGDYQNALQDILEAQHLGVKIDPEYVRDLRERLKL